MRGAIAGTIVGFVAVASLVGPTWAAPPHAVLPLAAPAGVARIEFWCSPGYAPRGGRCIATISRDELFVYETDAYAPVPRRHRRHPSHGLRELY